jgi:hypothetical protein
MNLVKFFPFSHMHLYDLLSDLSMIPDLSLWSLSLFSHSHSHFLFFK